MRIKAAIQIELLLLVAFFVFLLCAILFLKTSQRKAYGYTSVKHGLISVSLPDATGYVTDELDLLDYNMKRKIETICEELDPIAQIAVCIIDSTYPMSIEDYSIKLAEKWKVGYKGKDNGIILLLAKSDRKVRIEVGRGIEHKINDAEAGRILDNDVIPFFKRGEWAKGVLSGVLAIEERLKQ